LAAMGFAIWIASRWWTKLIAAVCVFLIFAAYPYAVVRKEQETQRAQQERYARAKALFDERCKTAGEKISKTIDQVEGILLFKIRPDKVNFSDQYEMNDPFGRDLGGQAYIGSFLRPTKGQLLNPRVAEGRRHGFRYVEVPEPEGKGVRQYTGAIVSNEGRAADFHLEIGEVADRTARYGVTYQDISTHEDRQNWIAGGTLQVIDIQLNEVIAERRGYIFDPGLGSTDGGRGPWESAVACEGLDRKYGHNARFVQAALKPTEGK
jgi:hypothetical protein